MKVSENCLDLIKKWEALRLEAYLDPVKIPTIGYGTIRYRDGRSVRLGEVITETEANSLLLFEVEKVAKDLETPLSGIDLNQNQIDAIVSLCYNIGVGGFKGSTILRKLKEGDFPAAAAAFDLWNKGTVNGVKTVLQGLVNRRREERALFEKSGGEGELVEAEVSPQDRITALEGYREGNTNIIAAMAGDEVVELLVVKSEIKEDLINILQQYKNAKTFAIAPPGKAVPAGPRTDVIGKSAAITSVKTPPTLERGLLTIGMDDDDDGRPGADIAELQRRLQDLRYYTGKVDGIFGKGTDEAVRTFQTDIFGSSEADGKVGPLTWAKLWGEGGIPAHSVTGTFSAGKNYLYLTKTSQKDSDGCVKLKLEYIKDGQSTDSLMVVSGTRLHQVFKKGADSQPGTNEPLPEGQWSLHDIEWRDGRDNFDGRSWASPGDGLGPAKIRLDYVPVNGTRRGNIEIHIDWNKRRGSPGTAGCIGINSIEDFKRLVTWLRETDPRDLYVDWGLGIQIP